MIVILGPTASGKTSLAAKVALEFDGEVISADSRQVYKGLDIGTGKDLEDYIIRQKKIPYHLIDIIEPGYEYNLFEFQRDFLTAYHDIKQRNKLPVLCGGTGLYIEAVLSGFDLPPMKKDPEFEHGLQDKTIEDLVEMLKDLRPLHNTTDMLDKQRLIKAIEIATPHPPAPSPLGEGEDRVQSIEYVIFGIRFEREEIRKRITERLERRLQQGLIEEVRKLSDSGVGPDQLKFYGLEYRFITMYLLEEITYSEMFRLLNTAIHQYAKRQMTWFRKMERSGFIIHWIDGTLDLDEKINIINRELS